MLKQFLNEVEIRQRQEYAERQARFSGGLKGFWDTLVDCKNHIAQRNQFETYQAERRDQKERDTLILAQLQERQDLQKHIVQHEQTIEEEKQTAIKTVFEQETRITQSQQQEFTQEYEPTIERDQERKHDWGRDF